MDAYAMAADTVRSDFLFSEVDHVRRIQFIGGCSSPARGHTATRVFPQLLSIIRHATPIGARIFSRARFEARRVLQGDQDSPNAAMMSARPPAILRNDAVLFCVLRFSAFREMLTPRALLHWDQRQFKADVP
jgi:hypothetical protein